MLSSTILGMLNEIVTKERGGDPFRNNLLEIHVGLIHGSLLSEFEKARDYAFGMNYLCTLNGINIFVNFNIKEASYIPIFKNRPYEDQLPKEVVEVGGFKPTKNWIKKYGIKGGR